MAMDSRLVRGLPIARFEIVKNSSDCSWTKMVHVKFLVCVLLDIRSMNEV